MFIQSQLNSLINNDNKIIQTITYTIITSLIYNIIGKIQNITFTNITFTNIISWFTNIYNHCIYGKYNYIEFIAEPVAMKYSGFDAGIRMGYSKKFLALLDHIHYNNKSLKHLREVDEYNGNWINNSNTNQNEKPYVSKINIEDRFAINEDKTIFCSLNLNYSKSIERTGKDEPNTCICHQLIIYSYTKNIQEIKDFIDEIYENYKIKLAERNKNKQYFFHYHAFDVKDNKKQMICKQTQYESNKNFKHLFIENKDLIINEIKFFINNPEWYKENGIPYHLGIMLHGTPGCGKTSFIKSLIAETKYNAIYVDLNKITSSTDFENIFNTTEINGNIFDLNKRIYILEDIDCISDIVIDRNLKKDEPIKENISIAEKIMYDVMTQNKDESKINDTLNLSTILNVIDGIIETPGRIIIMTTNCIDKLDKALIRPGRIDIKIEFKKASKDIILDMLSSFYKIKKVELYKKYKIYIDKIDNYKFTGAEISNLCLLYKSNIEECFEHII